MASATRSPTATPFSNPSWRRLLDIEHRVQEVGDRWLGTPYMSGQRVRGAGCDCVQLVAGLLDDLFRQPPTQIPRVKPDSGVHNRLGGLSTVVAFRKGYRSTVVRDGILEPGDVVVATMEGGRGSARNGNHLMLTGSRPWTIYHAVQGVGVCLSSVGALRNGILRVYRPLNKDYWI